MPEGYGSWYFGISDPAPIGTIPDIIKYGDTGLIMGNNSPGCIVKNIDRALKDPTLEKIVLKNKKIEREFTFESTIKQWKRILDNS